LQPCRLFEKLQKKILAGIKILQLNKVKIQSRYGTKTTEPKQLVLDSSGAVA